MSILTEWPQHPLVKNLQDNLANLFRGLPHLPKKVRQALLAIAPFIIIIFCFFLITELLQQTFRFDLVQIWLFQNLYQLLRYLLNWFILLILLNSFTGLLQKKTTAWQSLFFAVLLTFLCNLVTIAFHEKSLLETLLSLFLSLYLLYELQSEFHSPRSPQPAFPAIKKRQKNKTSKK